MARHATIGYETGAITSEGWGTTGSNAVTSVLAGSPTIQSSIVRSGDYAAKIDATTPASHQIRHKPNSAAVGSNYTRFYVYFSSFGTGSATGKLFGRPGTYEVLLNASNQLQLRRAIGSTNVGSPSAALSTGVWYRIEVGITAGAGSNDDGGELRLDGVTVASESGQTISVDTGSNSDIGWDVVAAGTTGPVLYLDDYAHNDDSGSDENSWPGEGRVVALRPTYDVAVGANWQGPQTTGSDTTDLYQNVDNFPHQGVAHSDVDANAGKYVFHNTTGSVTNLAIGLESYTAAGVPSGSRIKTVQGFARVGSDNTTNTTGAISVIENPDQVTETNFAATNSFDASNVVAGTEPTGWWTAASITQYNPTVVLGDPVEMRVGKRTSTTRAAMVSAMYVLVEYVEPLTAAVNDSVTVTDSISIKLTKGIDDSVTVSDSIAKTVGMAQADSVTVSDSIAKTVSMFIDDTVTVTDALVKAVGVFLSDIAVVTDDIDPVLTPGATTPSPHHGINLGGPIGGVLGGLVRELRIGATMVDNRTGAALPDTLSGGMETNASTGGAAGESLTGGEPVPGTTGGEID